MGFIKKMLKKRILTMRFLKQNPQAKVGRNFEVKGTRFVHCEGSVILGDNCKILCWNSYNGKKFIISPNVELGTGLHVTRGLTIQCARKVVIGKDVLVASDVFIIDYDHGLDPDPDSYLENDLVMSDGVIIQEGVWIGNNVIILGGVTIGKKAVIGAGSIVTHDVPAYTIVGGNPARVIKRYNFKKRCWEKV